MQPVYTFNTDRFKVTLTLEPEDMDPRDSFDDCIIGDVIDGIESGRYLWFCAKVTVACDGRDVADEYLGGCCYESVEDFRRDGYFRSMVREACKEARRTLLNPPKLRAA